MNQDITPVVRAWLDETISSAPAPVALDRAVAAVVQRTPQRRGWWRRLPAGRPLHVFGATKFVVAGVVVALFGGFLLSAVLTRVPSQESIPGMGAAASQHASSEITPGSYTIPWGGINAVHLTVPAGWSRSPDGASLCKLDGETGCPEGGRVVFAVHEVSGVVRDDVCRWDSSVPHQHFEGVGQSVDELVWVLRHQAGTRVSRPQDVAVSGYPAQRLMVTLTEGGCAGGPEGRFLWQDTAGPGSGFSILSDSTGRIDVADVDGLRLVITSSYRDASSDDIAELDAIVDSIDIERGITGLEEGRHSLAVDGVPLSFAVPPRIAGGWDQFDRISINKSVRGPQGAEAMIYWTSFPDATHAQPCTDLAGLPADASAADVAAAMAAAPGTELVSGPSDVSVGGRTATHVVVRVLETNGCDPGFFYTWEDIPWGPLWDSTEVGDTIRAWVVEVDGTRLVIVGETQAVSSPDPADIRLTEVEAAALDTEIDDIIDSIRFE